MAGLGFKDFQVGEVLTSADVDGYLMQQTVMRFADSAVRGSALGTATGTAVALAEGMVTYLDDVNELQFYNGSAWIATTRIIQTVSAVKTNQFSMTGTTPTLVTGLSVNITPTKTSSNILIVCGFNLGNDNGSGESAARLERSSTAITERNDGVSGDNNRFQTLSVIDNPATTSSINYNLKVWSPNNVGTVYVNESGTVQRSTLFVAEID